MSSSSSEAPLCRHIKVSGTRCGSPALRHKNFCFYHQENRPRKLDCYYNPDEYPTGEIALPYFEDAHSIQSVIRQTVHMVLQKRLERKTASLVLYALQIASSNLKRMDLEKPQPEQVSTDIVKEERWGNPIAAPDQNGETAQEISENSSEESSEKSSASAEPANHDEEANPVNASTQINENEDRDENRENDRIDEDLPPGTIQASYQPAPQMRSRPSQNQRKRQYVI
jgi:hypothetical protein